VGGSLGHPLKPSFDDLRGHPALRLLIVHRCLAFTIQQSPPSLKPPEWVASCFHTSLPHPFSIPIFQIRVNDPHPRDGESRNPTLHLQMVGLASNPFCHLRFIHVLLSDMYITKFSKSVVDEHDVNEAYCWKDNATFVALSQHLLVDCSSCGTSRLRHSLCW